MTFKELVNKLLICIKIQNRSQVELLYNLEVDFKEINEVEYGFFLAKEKDPDYRFNTDVGSMVDCYNELSESDKKKAYIYPKYDMADFTRLYLGVR